MGAVVFDLDGTLVDSAPDIRRVANRLLAAEGAPPITLAQTHGFIGMGSRAFVQRMMAAQGLPMSELGRLHAGFLAGYEGVHDEARLFPGVTRALEDLRSDGHVLGLCTNKPEAPARALIAHLDLARLFDIVIGGDSLPQSKPDPAPLLAAFAGLGDPLAFVGDSEVDRDTALAAGVPFALYSGGYRRGPVADFPQALVFDDWARLRGIVAGL